MIRLRTIIFLLTALSAAAFSEPSLDPSKAMTQYGHDVWNEDNGLPQNSVMAMAQTPDGYIWMGTQEGLARFDGVKFDVFDKRNTPEMKMNEVPAIVAAHDGSVWFAVIGQGLLSYSNGAFHQHNASDGTNLTEITSLCEAGDGSLWIGTKGDGLLEYSHNTFSQFVKQHAPGYINALHEDRNGTLWIGGYKSIVSFRDGKFTAIDSTSGYAGASVSAICEDKYGALWFGTDAGLMKLKNGLFTSLRRKDGLSSNVVLSLMLDDNGALWAGTYDGGLNRIYEGAISVYNAQNGLTMNDVGSLLVDREGSLWIGTEGGGVNRFKETKFRAYGKAEGLADEMTYPILEDHTGAIWVGSAQNTLTKLSHGTSTILHMPACTNGSTTHALYEDAAGNLWVGTYLNGLFKYSGGAFTHYDSSDGLKAYSIGAITGDGSGGLWVGTDAGLAHFVDGKFTMLGVKDGLSAARVTGLHLDTKHNLWVGTYGGSLNRYSDGTFTTFTKKDGYTGLLPWVIYEDAEGTIWAGTADGGLNRYKDGKWFVFGVNQGLLDDNIFSILEDGGGNLWMTSNKGIFRVSKNDLDKVAKGTLSRAACISYSKADGMRSRECNGGFQPSSFRAHDGTFWFPTVKGLVSIDPEHLMINNRPPLVVIENFMADAGPVNLHADTTLAAGTTRFEFHYAGLSFLAPEYVSYKYKLEGFDKEWMDVGTHRAAYYTNLPPGRYTFKVIAANSDGVWNNAGASYAFTLEPHFYQTPFFFGLCAIAVGFIGLGGHKVRMKQVKSKELERLVAERTKDLREAKERTEAALAEIKAANGTIHEQAELLDRAHDAIFLRELSGDIKFWNKGAERLYGWSMDEVVGKNSDEILCHNCGTPLEDAKTAVHSIGEWRGELNQITKGGKEIIVQSHWSLVCNDKGIPKAVLIINTDITEKKKIESQFLRAQRMQSLGTLAGGIAHDLNNVLSPILLSIEVLRRKLTDEASMRALQMMDESAQRGAGIVKQVLTFSRGMEGARSAVQIKYIVSELERIVKDTFPREIQINANLGKGLWMVSGDPTQLYQVLMNLSVNARDAMPVGGVLTISAENIVIDEHYVQTHRDATAGNYLVVSVADTGTGIPADVLDKIFEPFFTTKELGKGTGLGLSTAIGIVKSHGGFINVYSEAGKGTKFDVYLPAATGIEQAAGKSRQKSLPRGSGELVLVVDDEPTIRETNKSTLESYGYRVISAANGVEAIMQLQSHPGEVKIVITDMMMPVMDGATAIEKLRAIDPTLKFIAVSGLVDDKKVAEISSLGAVEFLQKPFGTEKILMALRDITSRKTDGKTLNEILPSLRE